MYCPNCAAQNVEGARYCRSCGADISLVPQALTGRLSSALAEAEDEGVGRRGRRRRRREKEPATVEGGIKNIFVGVAFFLVAFSVYRFMPGGFVWWYWMLIPAFAAAGEGVGQIMRARREQHMLTPPFRPAATTSVPPAARLNELPPRDTSEIYTPPGSITEGTTRHLDATRDKR